MKNSERFDINDRPGESYDSDNAVHSLLRGLRDAQPDPDFESRLLRRLAGRQETAGNARRPRWLPMWLGLSRGTFARRLAFVSVGVVAAVCILISFAVLRRLQVSPHTPSVADNTQSARPSAPRSAEPVVAQEQPAMASSASRARTHGLRSSHQPAPPRDEITTSFPAPPMPLTAQERLLLRMARADEQQRSTLLDPGLRASADAARAEEFQRFFIAATTIRDERSLN